MEKVEYEEIKKLYNQGMTYKAIADKFECSVNTIKYIAKKNNHQARTSGRQKSDVVGKKFGNLTVLRLSDSQNKHPLYTCKCDCGEIVERTASSLTCNPKKEKVCWSCRNKLISTNKWKGHGEISGDFWSAVLRSATARGLEFGLTIEQAWTKFVAQQGKCALSGMHIALSRAGRDTASLDRIDSSIGYTIANTQWVHKKVNIMKMDLPEKDFINFCAAITSHNS